MQNCATFQFFWRRSPAFAKCGIFLQCMYSRQHLHSESNSIKAEQQQELLLTQIKTETKTNSKDKT